MSKKTKKSSEKAARKGRRPPSAAAIRDALLTLADARGVTTPERIVEVASDPDHILHPKFTWDNDVAGHLYRLEQARELLRIHVQVRIHNDTYEVPIFVHDPASKKASQYRAWENVRTEPLAAQAALQNELRALQGHVRRVRDLAASLGLTKSVVKRLRTIDQLAQEIEARLAA